MTCALPQLKKRELSLKTATRHGRYLGLVAPGACCFLSAWAILTALAGYRKHKRRGDYHSRRFFWHFKADDEEKKIRIMQTAADSFRLCTATMETRLHSIGSPLKHSCEIGLRSTQHAAAAEPRMPTRVSAASCLGGPRTYFIFVRLCSVP